MGFGEKWVRSSEPEEQGEEEESLSLCDLPVNLLAEDEEGAEEKPLLSPDNSTNSEDFDFGQLLGSSMGSKSSSSEMCAADDIFFQGQILPFRHSISSESSSGVHPFKPAVQRQGSLSASRSISRSESMDRSSSSGGFTRFSSRSSSINSHYSSSSSASTNSNSSSARPRIVNRFHAFPSPKPQILKTPNAPPLGSAAGAANRSKKSSIWETLRLGLVRAPEMEFQDLKSRSSVSRNSSTGSNKAEKQGTAGKNPPPAPAKTKRSYSTGRLLGGCDCTVGAVQPVALNHENIVAVKGSKKKHRDDRRRDKQGSEEKEKRPLRGKQEASRHRTVEWIKKLSSHGGFSVVGDHEEDE
ncbi:unnamed protein product [Linum tenue]|uniref:Uncharacterized protein n=1 Tax=Linum tenue TaxID=586396 RepID=A0AAV0NT46_9ROSI|nr:unnamed protein product [Linum tenue]